MDELEEVKFKDLLKRHMDSIISTILIVIVFTGILIYDSENNKNKQSEIYYREDESSAVTSAEEQITQTTATTTTITTQAPAEFPIDINLVTYEELLQIKGVGDVTARAIIDFRESHGVITNMDMLIEISGIGESRLNLLKEYLYVSESDCVTTTTTQAESQ